MLPSKAAHVRMNSSDCSCDRCRNLSSIRSRRPPIRSEIYSRCWALMRYRLHMLLSFSYGFLVNFRFSSESVSGIVPSSRLLDLNMVMSFKSELPSV